MKTIKASYEILNKDKIAADYTEKFISVKFICDSGVRYSIDTFGQKRGRHSNYSKDKFGNEITVIEPIFFTDDTKKMIMWLDSMYAAEKHYLRLLELGATTQEACSVLPNSLKTEVVLTMTIEEWKEFFILRCDAASSPQIRELSLPLLGEMINLIPVVFDDLINLLTGTSFEQFVIDAVSKNLAIRIDSSLDEKMMDVFQFSGSAPTPDELVRSLQGIGLMSNDSRDRSITRLPHIPSFLRDSIAKRMDQF